MPAAQQWAMLNVANDGGHSDGAFMAKALAQALLHARVALLVTDDGGRLQFANRWGEALIGAEFRLLGDRLAATDDRATPALRRAIEAAAGPSRRSQEVVLDTIEPTAHALRVVVAPLDWLGDRSLAVVMAVDGAPRIDCHRLQTAFDLTPAEARLLHAIIGGVRIADHAADFGIKLSTAKTHLRQLFLKFGENRQTDLVRRALTDPALRLALTPACG